MGFIKKLFQALTLLVLGFIGLVFLIGIFASSDTTGGAQPPQQAASQAEQIQLSVEESAVLKLKAELENNREGVIQEIQDLMTKRDYVLARQKADRFRRFNDAEINQLAVTAAAEQENIEKAKREEEERSSAVALQELNKSTDKIEGIDWYRDKSSPAYTNDNGFFIYMGKREGGKPWLRLRIQYYADDWLFIESFIVVADGQRFDHASARFERDNEAKIWEWYDENLSEYDMAMIKAVISSKDATIRFNGSQYRHDETISQKQKIALQNVITAYESLLKIR